MRVDKENIAKWLKSKTRKELIDMLVWTSLDYFNNEWMSATYDEVHDFIMNEKNIEYYSQEKEIIENYKKLHK